MIETGLTVDAHVHPSNSYISPNCFCIFETSLYSAQCLSIQTQCERPATPSMSSCDLAQ